MIDNFSNYLNIGDEVVMCVSNELYVGRIVAMEALVTIECTIGNRLGRKSASPRRVLKLK